MKEFDHKILNLFTTSNPAPPTYTPEATRPTTRSLTKQHLVSPPPKMTQDEFLVAGGYQVIKRGRNSPDANNPTKYRCTDEDGSESPVHHPLTQEDQEHRLGGDAQI